MISGPLRLKKLELVSPATAFARRVFPVPGGPWRSTPLGASTPSFSNSSGCLRGSSIISRTFCISSPSPPISSYVILGIWASASGTGFSLIETWVRSVRSTGSPAGFWAMTIRSSLLPIMLSSTTSPLTTTLFSRSWARYGSAPWIFRGEVGAKVIDWASFGTTRLMVTFSSMLTPAFRRMFPSILTVPVPTSFM
jgi:hypothetical protein